jgi:hypothetical protein
MPSTITSRRLDQLEILRQAPTQSMLIRSVTTSAYTDNENGTYQWKDLIIKRSKVERREKKNSFYSIIFLSSIFSARQKPSQHQRNRKRKKSENCVCARNMYTQKIRKEKRSEE